MSALPSPEPRTPSPLRLPPTDRDFEIYDAVHIDCHSTRCLAEKHQISQTRVRQIIRRVVQWLGEVIPPQTKVAKEQETHLARQIAADRFQRQLEEATEAWQSTQELKYAGLRIRLTTAQARLGAVSGLLGGLAADAIEGLPVPAYQPPAWEGDAAWEGEAPAEPVGWDKDAAASDGPPSSSAEPNPYSDVPVRPSLLPPPNAPKDPRRRAKLFPLELCDHMLDFDDITPEIIAARAAWGCPFPPQVIKALEDYHARLRAAAITPTLSPPPFEDCSPLTDQPVNEPSAESASSDETTAAPTPCNVTSPQETAASTPQTTSSQPLLTPENSLPVIELKITPHQPGASLSPSPAHRQSPPPSPPPVTPHSALRDSHSPAPSPTPAIQNPEP